MVRQPHGQFISWQLAAVFRASSTFFSLAFTRLRAAESVVAHAAKAIEIEEIEARVSELERAAETAKKSR
jgi:hypothetical protein